MIRTLLKSGGILVAWTLASVPVVLVVPWVGALLALALSLLPVGLHVWLPKRRGHTDKLTVLRAKPLPGLRDWLIAGLFFTPALALSLGIAYQHVVPMPEAPSDFFTEYYENGGWLAVAILTVLWGPTVEEFVFRGWIQSALAERLSPTAAITGTSILFALIHGSVEGLPLFFGIGCLFGWAVWRSGSIWAGILLHGAYNGALMSASGLQNAGFLPIPDDLDVGGVGFAASVAVLIVAVGAIIRLGGRAGRAHASGIQEPAEEGVPS